MDKHIIIVLGCLCLVGPLGVTTGASAADLAHRWSFNGDLVDSVGGQNAVIVNDGANDAILSNTEVTLTGGAKGASDYIDLPDGIVSGLGDSATVEIWATQLSVQNWSRIFDFGVSTTENVFMSWTMGTGLASDRVEWLGDEDDTVDNTNGPYELGTEYHIVCVFEPGSVTWYSAPAGAADLGPAKGSFETANRLSQLNDTNCWLGQSQWPDATANASFNECRLWIGALTVEELEMTHDMGPDGLDTAIASAPTPRDAEENVLPGLEALRWSSGSSAASHDVYFGETFDDVNTATTSSPLFKGNQIDATYPIVDRLVLGKTYYWRVDEVNDLEPESPWKGKIWSFTVEPVGIAMAGDLITTTASSSTNDTQVPDKTIDGSGLLDNDVHTNLLDDMWLSSLGDTDPWIQYEFDKPYKLYRILVWNHNSPLEPSYGLGVQDVNVVYSLDGTNWTDIGTPQVITRATGTSENGVNSTIEMGNVYAKYVKLLIKSNRNPFGAPQYGLSEVRFLYIPTWARELEPADGTDGLDPIVSLRWRAGREAAQHQVYLGTDANDLSLEGSTTEPSLDVSVDLSSTYYWQVVEVNEVEDPCAWATDIQSFSTADFIMIDDMESYRDSQGFWIWEAWDDGVGDPPGNGSVVGHGDLPEMEIVFEGSQSMPMRYNGASEATYALAWTDWTAGSMQSLRLTFSGGSDDTGSGLFVRLNDGQAIYYPDDGDLRRQQWTQWDVPLSSFSDVDISNVISLTIGVTSGQGMLYIDAIGLYPEVAEVSMLVDPGADGLAARYSMEGDMSDSSGNGLDGEVFGGALFNQGMSGMGRVLTLDGLVDYATLPIGSVIASADSMTFAIWANFAGGDPWQRLIDFGSDTTTYMFLTPENGTTNVLRFAITTAGYAEGAESILDGPSALSPGWHHVAVSIDGSTMSMALYLDGIAVATGPTATLPSDLGNTTQNYVGDSQYTADPFYAGDVDELLIYTRALSPGEIRYLAGRL
ncbi:MAG: discoidin domain-containing protein [Phycisphaerales bacterium]|nr:MAG: discoidin domain-containing protein [Phycisphaerales bacterium]